MNDTTTTYYAEMSLPSLQNPSFTLWTNLDPLYAMLYDHPLVVSITCQDRDGQHLSFVVDLYGYDDYEMVVQDIRDAVLVENLLHDVEIDL